MAIPVQWKKETHVQSIQPAESFLTTLADIRLRLGCVQSLVTSGEIEVLSA